MIAPAAGDGKGFVGLENEHKTQGNGAFWITNSSIAPQ